MMEDPDDANYQLISLDDDEFEDETNQTYFDSIRYNFLVSVNDVYTINCTNTGRNIYGRDTASLNLLPMFF